MGKNPKTWCYLFQTARNTSGAAAQFCLSEVEGRNRYVWCSRRAHTRCTPVTRGAGSSHQASCTIDSFEPWCAGGHPALQANWSRRKEEKRRAREKEAGRQRIGNEDVCTVRKRREEKSPRKWARIGDPSIKMRENSRGGWYFEFLSTKITTVKVSDLFSVLNLKFSRISCKCSSWKRITNKSVVSGKNQVT